MAGTRVAEAEARLTAGEFRNRLFLLTNGALILRGQADEASDRTRKATGSVGSRQPIADDRGRSKAK